METGTGMLSFEERGLFGSEKISKGGGGRPSIGLPQEVVDSLCDAGVKLAESVGYDNAGTVEFLLDQETNEWFFIEMNPRIQVEHTVTEQITGIDIVRSQILIAMNHDMHGKKISIPKQHLVPRNGCAVQCRIMTEDPERDFLRIMVPQLPIGSWFWG